MIDNHLDLSLRLAFFHVIPSNRNLNGAGEENSGTEHCTTGFELRHKVDLACHIICEGGGGGISRAKDFQENSR